MKPFIEFKDVTFQYHSQSAPTLHNITVTINHGEKILVVGPSGSGKSTFAHCINGLIPHIYQGSLSGTVTVNGKDVSQSNLSELSFEVGTVLQDTDGQFIGLTVAEDVAFSLENECVDQAEIIKKVGKLTTEVGLETHLFKRPQELSGGQKQRVSMAGVLIDEVPLLLLDEPLANLDPATGQESMALIDQMCQEQDRTVVIVEHRLEDVLYRKVDRILVFEEGTIIADLTPEALLKSTVLNEVGIREPLYVSAMKYAGVNLQETTGIASVATVASPDLLSQLNTWESQTEKPELPASSEELLELSELNYKYPSTEETVLAGLSVTFNRGEMLSIVGKNGAGKSTLCKAICGFIKPQSGSLLWQGRDFTELSIKERADHVGFVMQNPNQMISQKMIVDEVGLGLVLRGVPQEEVATRVKEVLHICGLYPFRNWPISALSFGQKKRVTIAAILVLEPAMILLDEPTAGQDLRHYTEMMVFLEKLSQQGIAIAMVTHDMHLMLEYTTRALVIGEGRILADTTPAKVLTNPALIAKASLKETSLFTFAKKIGMENPVSFTEKFIAYEREVRLG
ncbi:ABC transporter ATP-binding protein [Vagococcus salmoninarum]|uniref:ABC transporter ATP-binding protein n=1 Tax=Vagococcus salmoninarum TaxID=2739 RepID=UPI00187E196B|nr:ABC transporter ATP-binding protein [Vagococcus salmoninarum]MBE9388685.1 ABC transporter ATP-binding protein [Vagococcus salmoninarum]